MPSYPTNYNIGVNSIYFLHTPRCPEIENEGNIYTLHQPVTNLPCMTYSNSGVSSYARHLTENQFSQPPETPHSNTYLEGTSMHIYHL